MATNHDLTLTIKALDKATAPLRKVAAEIRRTTEPVVSVAKAAREFGGNLLGLGAKVAGLAVGAGLALGTVVKGAMDAGDTLSEVAQRVGLGVDSFAQLQFAAAQADISAEDFNASMDKFNVNMGLMRANSGPIVEFLGKVGPGLLQQVKHVKSNEEAIKLLSKAFVAIKDPQRRAALAQELFGKSGKQFGQFLGQGQEAIDAYMKRFEELAGSQKEFADGASDLDNATRETEVAFLGLRNAAAGALFPALTELAHAVTDVLAGERGNLKAWAADAGKAIGEWVKSGGVQRLVADLKDLAHTVSSVVDKVGGIRNALIIAGAVMGGDTLISAGRLTWQIIRLGGAILQFGGWAIQWSRYLWMMRASIAAGFLPSLSAAVSAVGTFASSLPAMISGAAAAAAPFVAVGAAVGAVSLAIYELIKNWQTLKEMVADGNTFGAIKEFYMHPVDALKTAKDYYFGGSGNSLGAAAAAPSPAAAAAGGVTKVQVDLNGLPPGTKVTQESSGPQQVDLSAGYVMAGS